MADSCYLAEPHRFVSSELIEMIIKASKAIIYGTYPMEQLSPQLSVHLWERDQKAAPARGALGTEVKRWKEALKALLEEEGEKSRRPELAGSPITPVLEYLIEHLIVLRQEAFEFRVLQRVDSTTTYPGNPGNEHTNTDTDDHVSAAHLIQERSAAASRVQDLLHTVNELEEKLLVADKKVKQVEQELEAANQKIWMLAAERCDEEDQRKTKELAKEPPIAELKIVGSGQQRIVHAAIKAGGKGIRQKIAMFEAVNCVDKVDAKFPKKLLKERQTRREEAQWSVEAENANKLPSLLEAGDHGPSYESVKENAPHLLSAAEKKTSQEGQQVVEEQDCGQGKPVHQSSHHKKSTFDADHGAPPFVMDTALPAAESTQEEACQTDPLSKAIVSMRQSKRTILLSWCQGKLAPHIHERIENFNSSWRDGKAMYFLIKSCLEDMDWDYLSCMEKATPRENFETAMQAARRVIKVHKSLNLEDILNDDSSACPGIQEFIEEVYNRMNA